jgi:hypothetical protein
MPKLEAVAAKGERVRKVSRHDFTVDKQDAMARALALVVTPGRSEAVVKLTNTGAHHALPTGRPEQRLKLELIWSDESGKPVGEEVRLFARQLVDAEGAPAPSFRAVRESDDRRLRHGETWQEGFSRPGSARSVKVRVLYESFDPAFSDLLGTPDSLVLLERTEALSP